jgi:enamine deaminase RidA (YjgF/YER057c/UK114 family)
VFLKLAQRELGMERRNLTLPALDVYGILGATEVINPSRVLYCSGMVAEAKPGAPPLEQQSTRDQLAGALDSVEDTLRRAGYALADVVRLNLYTTDTDGVMASHDLLTERLRNGGAKVTGTLLGVARLALPHFKVEIEVTAVK